LSNFLIGLLLYSKNKNAGALEEEDGDGGEKSFVNDIFFIFSLLA